MCIVRMSKMSYLNIQHMADASDCALALYHLNCDPFADNNIGYLDILKPTHIIVMEVPNTDNITL